MLRDARRKEWDKVLAVKVDRIARSLKDLLEIAGTLGQHNIGLSFTDQDLDISSSEGRLMFQIMGAFAEYEREIIIERTKAGMRRARKQGKKIGRPKIEHEGDFQENGGILREDLRDLERSERAPSKKGRIIYLDGRCSRNEPFTNTGGE